MNNRIIIDLDKNKNSFSTFSLTPTLGKCTNAFSLCINCNKDDILTDILKEKDTYIKEVIEEHFIYFNKNHQAEYILANFDNLLDLTDYIEIGGKNSKEILDFLNNNKIDKKIILKTCINICNIDKIRAIKSTFKDYVDNLYIFMEGNKYKPIQINKLEDLVINITSSLDYIKKLNFSKIEEIMFVYNIIRSKIYKDNYDINNQSKSRDLIEILNNDYIVCEGYANLFKTYLTYLGHDVENIILFDRNNKDNGHIRSMIYIKDPKYNIDGLYFFDPTGDSKTSEDDNDYINRFTYFAKTKSFFDELDNKHNLEDKFFQYTLSELFILIIKRKELGVEDLHIIDIMRKYAIYTNTKYNSLLAFTSDNFEEDNINALNEIGEKINTPIPFEVLIKVFNNVRKKEYYINSDKYPYNINDLFDVVYDSLWDLEIDKKNAIIDEYISSYIKEEEIDKDIERVKFTKVLQKIRDKNK